mgnify:CR=1 FL=1
MRLLDVLEGGFEGGDGAVDVLEFFEVEEADAEGLEVVRFVAAEGDAGGDLDAWRRVMAAIASSTSAGVKFSGVLMGLGDERPDSDFQPACDHLMDCFGPERLLWGSDWPHLLADSDYASWYARSNRLLAGFGQAELDCIFGETAARFYGI